MADVHLTGATDRADDRAARLAAVVAAVTGGAVREAEAAGVVLLDDGSPEASLAMDWCGRAAPVWRVPRPTPEDAAPELDRAAAAVAASVPRRPDSRGAALEAAVAELQRLRGRLIAVARRGLTAHPANKTALLLGPAPPPEALLPLGDLYASQVEKLAGGWTAPARVREWAEAAGGIASLDRALSRLVDERRPAAEALSGLPDPLAAAILEAFAAGRPFRRRTGLVPKLGGRTLGIDLFA